jgi:hypothetical protein
MFDTWVDVYFGQFLENCRCSAHFRLLFPRYKLRLKFDRNWVGLHFWRFSSKPVRPPCLRSPISSGKMSFQCRHMHVQISDRQNVDIKFTYTDAVKINLAPSACPPEIGPVCLPAGNWPRLPARRKLGCRQNAPPTSNVISSAST